MVRAILFDFYSVWATDTLGNLLTDAKALGPQVNDELATMVDHYYHGGVGASNLLDTFKWRLGRRDIKEDTLTLSESDLTPVVLDLMRGLHGHFLKVAILANLGTMELDYLTRINATHSLFEVIVSPLSLGSGQALLSQEVFAGALQAVGEQPNTCVAVSGNDDYLAFASNFGMQTIKFGNIDTLKEALSNLLVKDMPSYVDPT